MSNLRFLGVGFLALWFALVPALTAVVLVNLNNAATIESLPALTEESSLTPPLTGPKDVGPSAFGLLVVAGQPWSTFLTPAANGVGLVTGKPWAPRHPPVPGTTQPLIIVLSLSAVAMLNWAIVALAFLGLIQLLGSRKDRSEQALEQTPRKDAPSAAKTHPSDESNWVG